MPLEEQNADPAADSIPVDWLYVRDTIQVNAALRQEIQAELDFRKLPKYQGKTLALVARRIVHDPGYALAIDGYPLLVIAESYQGNGGALDASGLHGPTGAHGPAGRSYEGIGADGDPGGDGGPGEPGAAGSAVTVLAADVSGLHVLARGGQGGSGGSGGDGGHGGPGHVVNKPGGPIISPGNGGRGGNGSTGAVGGPGAHIVLHVVTQSSVTADGGGGAAGPAGAAGHGGKGGRPPGIGSKGADGRPGQPGSPGPAVQPESFTHSATDWWTLARTVLGGKAPVWADYRTRVGEYLFRSYAAAIEAKKDLRVQAGHEFDRALVLEPGQQQALRLSQYIAANLSPIGQPYNVDLVPDFPDYEKVVTGYDPIVKSLLDNAVNMLLEIKQTSNQVQRLGVDIAHVTGMQTVLKVELAAAQAGEAEAKAREGEALRRLEVNGAQIQAVIDQMTQESLEFPIGDVINTIAAFAKAAMAFAAFAGIVVALAAEIPEAQAAADPPSGELQAAVQYATAANLIVTQVKATESFDPQTGKFNNEYLVNYFDWSVADDPKLKDDKKAGVSDINSLFDVGKDFAEAFKLLGQLRIAAPKPETAAKHKELVLRHLELLADYNLAKLDSTRNRLLVAQVNAKIALNKQDLDTMNGLAAGWDADIAQVSGISRTVIAQTQSYVDVLSRYAFYAYRALDLWTFSDHSSSFSFDLGYLHPDEIEDTYERLARGDTSMVNRMLGDYLSNWTGMPALLQMHVPYDTYKNNLDLDPRYVKIADPAVLASLKAAGTASFTLTLGDFPAGFTEVKVERLHVGLVGATISEPRVVVLLEHTGQAVNRRKDGVVVNLAAPAKRSTEAATADNQDPDRGSTTARQAFWGRSPATTWRITIDADSARSASLDLSGLRELHLTFYLWHYGKTAATTPPVAAIAVPADYDGDGKPDQAVWQPADGTWQVQLSSGGPAVTVPWGQTGDLPVPADYLGAGQAQLAVLRPGNGKLYARPLRGGPPAARLWATSGYVPVPSEFPGMVTLAGACTSLAYRLSAAGRAAEAPDPQQRARDLCATLAQADPRYRTSLAQADVVLGSFLSAAGRHADAITAAQQGVDLFRQLADKPELAWALDNLARRFSAAGRAADAPAPEQEARDLYAGLSETNAAYRSSLGSADVVLGAFLSAAGRHAEAITAAQQGVDVFRQLADKPELAWAMENLAYRLSAAGRSADAPAPQQEARDLYAGLARTDPAYRQPTGAADVVLSSFLSAAGRHDEAIAAAQQGVDVFRQLADNPELAWALDNLAYRLSETGRAADAPAPQQECRDIYAVLAQTNAAYRQPLGSADVILGAFLSAAGRHAEAITAAQQGVDVFRQLADKPELAWALDNLAYRLSAAGRVADAPAAEQEARDLYAALAQADPSYQPLLAAAALRLAKFLVAANRRADAKPVAQQAVDLYQALASANPGQYTAALNEAKALRDSLNS
ncbi:tetratricopeptide repeat protein [Amycolatopsis sp. NPDC054798]